jgi:hypothetical protein
MAVGDVDVIIVNNPTAATIQSNLATLRATAGANGKYFMVSLNGSIILAAITEA